MDIISSSEGWFLYQTNSYFSRVEALQSKSPVRQKVPTCLTILELCDLADHLSGARLPL